MGNRVKQILLAAMLLLPVWPVGVCLAMPDSQAPASTTSDSAATDSAVPSCTLRIVATGFRNHKGYAGAAIFASPDGWPEQQDKAVAHDGFPFSGSETTLSFKLPPGKYAVVVLHDENKNEKLDRNFLGIPDEGFGFSNNPRVFMTAPSFAQATVAVTCPVTTIGVKMIYK
jgi:uncharacterized protein (DUF2141 family)